MVNKKIIINTDGGARGNPGPAAIGIVVCDQAGQVIKKHKEKIGSATNNYAEYLAVVRALEIVKSLHPTEIIFRIDSELIVEQLNQRFKIKNEELGKLFIKVWNLRQNYKKVSFTHVRRADNKLADYLVNEALDNK